MRFPDRISCILATGLALILVSSCASIPSYAGQAPHPQVFRGRAFPPVDFFASFISLPWKIILWNWKFNNHSISEKTEAKLVQYLERRNLPAFEETIFRLNQYAPARDLSRLIKNRHMAWPYRLLLGFPVTLIFDVLLPGRIFPWGDYYNPYTNTAHLYSDDPTIALHEAGHAYDDADFPYKGTYALLRIVPFFDLYQEWWATDEAIDYLIEIGDRETELRAYRTLWPAYGTYVGSYFPIPFGSAAGALMGHIVGRIKAAVRKRYYKRMDVVLQTPEKRMVESMEPSLQSESGQGL